jgi:hypothetical protein
MRFHYRLARSKGQAVARLALAIDCDLKRKLGKHLSKVRMIVTDARIHGAKKNIARTIGWAPICVEARLGSAQNYVADLVPNRHSNLTFAARALRALPGSSRSSRSLPRISSG